MRELMKITDAGIKKQSRPIRIVQFGEGNFLRAFADYMIDIANEKGVFDGAIAIVKPKAGGSVARFREQDCLYTVILRGKENGETVNTHRIVTSVSTVLEPFSDYEVYEALAKCPTVRFVISNTTEAGIVLDETDTPDGVPGTFPGKITKFLYTRYLAFGGDLEKGLIFLPTELIEHNGRKLKEYVLRLAQIWNLPAAFMDWVSDACIFTDTLVDRIVTGYPKEEAETLWDTLGYKDELLDVGEPFGLWVIESGKDISREFPLRDAGLPVVFTDDLRPYRECKVRVLNGAHTASVLMGYLCGFDIVRDCMQDAVMGAFIRRTVREEIVPLVPLPAAETASFADSVFERFENPYIDHALLAISLNSVSKWRARVLPSVRDYVEKNGTLPRLLTFSFAALLAFYSGTELRDGVLYARRANGDAYMIRDEASVLTFFAETSGLSVASFVEAAAQRTDFWGEDLSRISGFTDTVTGWLSAIRKDPAAALYDVLEEKK